MSLKYRLCVALLLYNTTFINAKTTVRQVELEDKGNGEKWTLFVSQGVNTLDERDSGSTYCYNDNKGICGDDEYEWTNGTCHKCLLHDDECETTCQCCSIDNMSCWQIGSRAPKCLCDRNYGWDNQNKECVYIPPANVLVITGYVALGATVIIAVSAIIVLLFKFCKGYYYRWRGIDTSHSSHNRRQFRRGHRQNARVPRQRRISYVEPSRQDPNYPTKPPEYEDIFGAPTISQAMPRQLTGSIRSLPPAYTPCEENTETTAPPQEPEPMTSQTDEVTSSQSVTMTTETTSAVVNNGFEAENHM